MFDGNVMATMILGADALHHHHYDVMNEEIIATEIERDTGPRATIARREVEAVVIVEAGGGVAGRHITVVRPAVRSSWKDYR